MASRARAYHLGKISRPFWGKAALDRGILCACIISESGLTESQRRRLVQRTPCLSFYHDDVSTTTTTPA